MRDAGIVCCVTTSTAPLFTLDQAAEHAHVNAVGAFRPAIGDHLIGLGAALAGGVPPSGGRTVFKTVGVALQDWAIAQLLAQRCLQ
ncbi:hypothetical protein ACFPOI_31700 [Nonomuraea angiospora]|uniref:Ornithine cyclodeaminase/alanine dehydrogenase-like protein (Mu-crystallin family) n=1 Tax=Nonomuraea angiospora TaxID=46172 RepID=A0ABR9LTI3_9ACTN|nr:hypothetical protein [Nonomuraea angiospora]MBE1583391.1 ornithine cyclodeaminase/alanine dehydrogenase-like protein (mu-crystallin family) [Nonomuraea angiospora]